MALQTVKLFVVLCTHSMPVASMQWSAIKNAQAVPPLDLPKLRCINTTLLSIQELVHSANNTAHDMKDQVDAVLNDFGDTLATVRASVNAAKSSPINIIPEIALAKADEFVVSANETLMSTKQRVGSFLVQISTDLINVMSALRNKADSIFSQFNVAMETVSALVAIPPPNSNSTVFIRHTSELTQRANDPQREPRHVATTLDLSVASKGSNGGMCQVAFTTITRANSTLPPFVDCIVNSNITIIFTLLSNLDTITPGLKDLDTTLTPALQALVDVGVPDGMLSPVMAKLAAVLATIDELAETVKGLIATIETTVSAILGNMAEAYAESGVMIGSVQEACLSGKCGAAAQVECQASADNSL